MEAEDMYMVLGIEQGGPEVSQIDVRRGYRAGALRWHPDKQVGKKPADISAAAAKFEKIQNAYDILGDEETRKVYDERRSLYKCKLEKTRKTYAENWRLHKCKLEKARQAYGKKEKQLSPKRQKSQSACKRKEEMTIQQLQANISWYLAEHARKRTKYFLTKVLREAARAADRARIIKEMQENDAKFS